MSIEHLQIILQIVSAIGVPIITAIVAWITNSLRKTNLRIDSLEKRFQERQLEDERERSKLSLSMARIEAQVKELSITTKRIEGWILDKKL